MNVWVASAGFQYCDAFVSIAGNTCEETMNALDDAMKSECESLEDEEKSADELMDEIWFVGPSLEDADSPDFALTPAQKQELLGGFIVTCYNAPDAPEVLAGKVGNAVGHTDVLATREEAETIQREWIAQGWLKVTIKEVPPSVTFLDTF